MSYDLTFCSAKGTSPSINDVKAFFENREHYTVGDRDFSYNSEARGVYFWFNYIKAGTYGDSEEEIPVGFDEPEYYFNINYSRPSFFIYEAVVEIAAFCKYFK